MINVVVKNGMNPSGREHKLIAEVSVNVKLETEVSNHVIANF